MTDNAYSPNGKELANTIKESADWCCQIDNLTCLCSACHLDYHRFGMGNITPGQLSLELNLQD